MQGVVQASHVAYLSSSDLATADIKEKRENTAKELGTYIHTYIHTYIRVHTYNYRKGNILFGYLL